MAQPFLGSSLSSFRGDDQEKKWEERFEVTLTPGEKPLLQQPSCNAWGKSALQENVGLMF